MDELTPARWRRIRPILDNALALPPAERTAFLREVCADDPLLHREVAALVAAEAGAASLLEVPLGEYARALMDEALGSGKALSQDRLTGRRDLETDDVVARFLAERQILATLQHARIASSMVASRIRAAPTS